MAITKNPYLFEPLNELNIKWLIDLYKKVFGVQYTLEQVKAKYQPQYTGIHAQGHFAIYQNKPVAFHGAIPVLIRYQGQVELCAQYGDAMTLQAHTGNGLFTKLGELTDQVLIEKGVKFVWGFPNQNSEYGYVNKLHWQGEARMQCYIFKLSSISSETVYRKTKLFERRNQERIKKELSSLLVPKQQLHSIDTKMGGGIDRSNHFYAYKNFSPNYFIELKGTKVWIKPLGGLLVGDIEVKNEQQLLASIEELKILAKQLGLNKLTIQASPKSQLNLLLKKHFSPIDTWLIGYKNFSSQFPLEKLQFTYGDLDTF